MQKKIVMLALAVLSLLASTFLIYSFCSQAKEPLNRKYVPLEQIPPTQRSPSPYVVPFSMTSPSRGDIQMMQSLSTSAVKIMDLCPELILGSHHLFEWDAAHQHLKLSQPFQSLLLLLRELGTLDFAKIDSLNDLNALLQKPQGEGGFLRKPGSERWDIAEQPLWKQKRADLEHLLAQLGLVHPQLLSQPIVVNHCIVFGARAERIDKRMQETIHLLLNGNLITDKVFLLGSKRKLIPEEKAFLEDKISTFSNEEQRVYWKAILAKEEQATEANACVLLWECLAPPQLQQELDKRVIPIQSTQIGFSYREREGHRTTTDVTTEDWTTYYQDNQPQTIFALAEQPYVRLTDQLQSSILTQAKRATLDLMSRRIANTTFYFVHPQPKEAPLMGVILDEIARNIYRTVDLLRYLDKLPTQ